ncbi:hypothetical protein SRB5_05590 [Streptomyces sp. RB5]|uniref:DUF3140 domain-containing protein n=1 Tax=Streptomyces smaragdinus TaxID=2585196 RepID=A0A7K0CAH1_9ACTN|nr:DUF3140 domain-containing protein [Streptomyces smaragdinus]MQY10451.1 hypothetical protein [Streptomyces smaragdinus]
MAHPPAGIPGFELDALWDEFHQTVNMTARELASWLLSTAAHETDGEEVSRHTGRHVLRILRKRRSELTAEDVDVMYVVVDTVTAQRRAQVPAGGREQWRSRLMCLGHDPVRQL